MAGVILPDVHRGEAVDLDAHFERHWKSFYGFLIAAIALAFLTYVVMLFAQL